MLRTKYTTVNGSWSRGPSFLAVPASVYTTYSFQPLSSTLHRL